MGIQIGKFWPVKSLPHLNTAHPNFLLYKKNYLQIWISLVKELHCRTKIWTFLSKSKFAESVKSTSMILGKAKYKKILLFYKINLKKNRTLSELAKYILENIEFCSKAFFSERW